MRKVAPKKRTKVARDGGVKWKGALVWKAGQKVDCVLCLGEKPIGEVDVYTLYIRVRDPGGPALPRPIGKGTICAECVERVRRGEGAE